MIESLLRLGREHWPTWFGEGPGRLKVGPFGAGAARHGRAIAFLFADDAPAPSVMLKMGFIDAEVQRLIKEFRALTEVRRSIPTGLRSTIPEPLGLYRSYGFVTVALGIVEGRRFPVPRLIGRGSPIGRRLMSSFWSQAFSWSTALAEATRTDQKGSCEELEELVFRFIASYPHEPLVARELHAFGRALGRAGHTWHPGWQHRDITFLNTLVHRGQMRFIDWEHAGGRSEPWFDLAYISTATVYMVLQQAGLQTLRDAALQVFHPKAWVGRMLAEELREAWSHPLPSGWGIPLAAMSIALRDRRGWSQLAAGFAADLLIDSELRQTAPWLVPR